MILKCQILQAAVQNQSQKSCFKDLKFFGKYPRNFTKKCTMKSTLSKFIHRSHYKSLLMFQFSKKKIVHTPRNWKNYKEDIDVDKGFSLSHSIISLSFAYLKQTIREQNSDIFQANKQQRNCEQLLLSFLIFFFKLFNRFQTFWSFHWWHAKKETSASKPFKVS